MDAIVDPPDDSELTSPPWGALGRVFTIGSVAGFGHLLLRGLNTLNIEGYEHLQQHVIDRQEGRPLITVANHTSTLDDPLLISAILPWSFYLTEPWHENVRWTLCAKEVCFRNELLRQFFQNGKTLPITRTKGDPEGGVHQRAMAIASRQLLAGKWVHVFPEGGISFSGKMRRMKQGVGKLVCDTVNGGKEPVVLPWFHSGMGHVMPRLTRKSAPTGIGMSLPRVFKTIDVVVGEPIDLSDLTCKCGQKDPQEVWRAIANRCGSALEELEKRVPPNPDQEAPTPADQEPPAMP